MHASYQPPSFEGYVPSPDSAATPAPVVIVGAGPVGLCCAIDLALHGVKAIVIDDNNTVSAGSRAICYAKRTLEILDRLGCGDAVVDRGVGWRVGKVFVGDRLAYQFDLLPEDGHRRPAFVNLQQYHLEEALLARLSALGGEVRWKNRCTGVTQDDDGRGRLALFVVGVGNLELRLLGEPAIGKTGLQLLVQADGLPALQQDRLALGQPGTHRKVGLGQKERLAPVAPAVGGRGIGAGGALLLVGHRCWFLRPRRALR